VGELAEERRAVSRAVAALGMTPVMFELGARPHPPRELYQAYLEQSDIFIGLYWERDGQVGPDMDVSGSKTSSSCRVRYPACSISRTRQSTANRASPT
jgi:hypothetical protein